MTIGNQLKNAVKQLRNSQNSENPNFSLESLTPEFDITPHYAKVNGLFHRIVKAVGYPRKVEDGWLETFLSASEPYDISMHIHPTTINNTLVHLHNQLIRQTSDLLSSARENRPNPSLEIKHSDTLKVYELLYRGEEKLFQVSLYVDSQAKNLKELDLLTEKCNANLNALLIMPQTTNYRMAHGIKTMLPLAIDAVDAKKDFTTSALSATFPFLYPVDSKKKGVFFAHERKTLNPLFIDFDLMSNKHFFVLGISGSGKSYTSKFLLMQQLLSQPGKVYILDPNAEYVQLAQKMKGEVIQLSKNSNSIINLFDLAGEDFGSKMLTLISVFDIITGGLTESQKGVLNDALLAVYKSKNIEAANPLTWGNIPPTFSNLKGVLKKMLDDAEENGRSTEQKSIEVLYNRVRMYSKNGFFGFLDRETKVNLRNNFIDFDLNALPSQVKQLVMFSVLELISREIKKDKLPKVILIDEGWSLLRSKEAESYILDFIKTSRKYNASIGFITQEIEDLLRSDGGKSILNTTSTKILLKQNSSNLDLITKSLALNEKERNYLLRAGRGEGLLITELGRYEFVVTAPEKIHKLITTNPNEEKEVEKEKEPKKKATKVEIDLSRGFYSFDEVTEAQTWALRKAGYITHQSIFLGSSGSQNFYVKRQGHESAEHALLCWAIANEVRKRGGKPKVLYSVAADVSFEVKGKRIGFEVETGENLAFKGVEGVLEKVAKRKEDCDEVIFVVTKRFLRDKYERITQMKTITRTQVVDTIKRLFR